MTYTFDDSVQRIEVTKIKQDPRNKQVHGEFDPVGKHAWLVEDIKQHGVLLPVILRPDKTLYDGHSRVQAAKRAGVLDVPYVTLRGEHGDDVFRSAQLARNISTYAKCVLYRERIEQLTTAGKELRAANLKQCVDPDDDEMVDATEQAWILVEEVLGTQRCHLQHGVRLLAHIEQLRGEHDPKSHDKAARIETVFRTRGLKPAQRLAEVDESLPALLADDGRPDCRSWEAHSPLKRRDSAREQTGRVAAGKPGWLVAADALLVKLRELCKQNNALSPEVAGAIDSLYSRLRAASTKPG